MKRSFSTSALVLALASTMAMTACGGGGGSGEPAKDGDSAGKDGGGSSTPDSGDPAADLQTVSDNLTKEVDAIVQPLKDIDALVDSITKLPADLKAAKSKANTKAVLTELKKILDGGDPAVDGLKLEDNAKAVVQDRIDKLKALKKSMDDAPKAIEALPGKIADTLANAGKILAKALPKYQAKISAPFGVSAEDKAKATADKDKIQKVFDDFKAKADGWKNLATELPAKIKDIPTKMAKAFK